MYGNAKQESAQRRKAEDLIDSLSAGRICGAAGAAGAGPSSAAASAFGRKKEAILVWPTKNEVEGAMMSKIISAREMTLVSATSQTHTHRLGCPHICVVPSLVLCCGACRHSGYLINTAFFNPASPQRGTSLRQRRK